MSLATQVQMSLIPAANHLCFPDGTPNARAIRETVFSGLPVEDLSLILGIPARTYGSWERGERSPSGAARSLLKLAAAEPVRVREILMGQHNQEGEHVMTT